MPDRANQLKGTAAGGESAASDLQTSADQLHRLAPIADQPDQQAEPVRSRAGIERPMSRLPIGSMVGCAGVSTAFENARVSSTRGVQMPRARPMKSIREERKPSGDWSVASTPMRLGVLVPGQQGMQAAHVLELGEEPVVLGMAAVGLRVIEYPFQVGHDLERSCRVRKVLHRDRPELRGVSRPRSEISTVVRNPWSAWLSARRWPAP